MAPHALDLPYVQFWYPDFERKINLVQYLSTLVLMKAELIAVKNKVFDFIYALNEWRSNRPMHGGESDFQFFPCKIPKHA